jgi:hypothetical protein
MELTVGKFNVTIKDSLTWGDIQQVQTVLASGAKIGSTGMQGYDANAMLEAKYKLLELAIVRITEDKKELPFTREWMNNLSVEEGDALYDAVDRLSKKK